MAWSIVRLGRGVRSWVDNILGTERHIFRNVSVRDPRHKSDHYIILGCLRNSTLREHITYLSWSKRLPIHPLNTPTREDGLFASLWRVIPKPKAWEARKNTWISADMWSIVYTGVSMCQDPSHN